MAKRGSKQFTIKELPKNWKDIIINLSLKGYSEVEIRAEIVKKGKTAKDIIGLWYKLQDRESEFKQTIIIGKALCEAWWTAQSRKGIRGRTFQSFVWFANMKNRFGWKDKTDIEHSMTDSTIEKFANLSTQALLEKANALIGKRAK